MRVGSVFSGIGGFDLGLERAGMEVVWQIEIDEYRRRVLERHWPDVPRYEDVRGNYELEAVDLICGGFPCEDISRAGRRAGLYGAKSGLWFEMLRLIRQLQPRYILVENTTSLTVRGLSRIVAQLAESGYDAEWDCLPAAAFGAPHIRDRLYLLAYPCGLRHGAPQETVFAGWASSQLHGGWAAQPDVDRVADGIPARVDRVAALGDAVTVNVIEWIGRRIMLADGMLL